MSSGDWFKTMIKRNKKKSKSKLKPASLLSNGDGLSEENRAAIEEIAATRIQTAYRGYKARKTLRILKATQRVRVIRQANPVKKQTSSTLSCIQSWNRLQAEIRARRAFMVTEGRNRQKRKENQLKLDAKLHNVEVEWDGSSDTKAEILARIHQREEAAVKRERTMAYAFSHQWRAKPSHNYPFIYEIGKGGWGWSWMDRWVAARPWEPRFPLHPENTMKKQPKKVDSSINQSALKLAGSIKLSNLSLNDGKNSRRKSLPADVKKVAERPKVKVAYTARAKPRNPLVNDENQPSSA